MIPGLLDSKGCTLSTTLASLAFLEIPLMKCIAHLKKKKRERGRERERKREKAIVWPKSSQEVTGKNK